MDMELYAELTDSIEYALDEADFAAKESKVRFSGTDVFRRVRERIGVIGQKVLLLMPMELVKY